MNRCHTRADWAGSCAVRAAHLLSVPSENSNILTEFERGAFIEMLISLVEAGREVFTSSSALSCLAGNCSAARNVLKNRYSLIDILAKVSKSNPNCESAAKAVANILPYTDHYVFRQIFIFLTLDESNPLCMKDPNLDLLNSIYNYVSENSDNRVSVANDKILLNAILKIAKSGVKASDHSRKARAVQILYFLAKETLNHEELIGNDEFVSSLACIANESKKGLRHSGVVYGEEDATTSHDASASAALALCELVRDSYSDKVVLGALSQSEYDDKIEISNGVDERKSNVMMLWERLQSHRGGDQAKSSKRKRKIKRAEKSLFTIEIGR